jgi:hypothetical protein
MFLGAAIALFAVDNLAGQSGSGLTIFFLNWEWATDDPGGTLIVNGAGYVTGSVVQLNGTALPTTYVSGTKLTTSISANLLATTNLLTNASSPPWADVTVMNPTGVVSNAFPLTIYPAITSLNPNSATAGDPGFTLTVNGRGYVTGSVVYWNDVLAPLTTTYVNGTKLTASISANLLANAGGNPWTYVTVINPHGGPGSNAAPFTIYPPLAITSLSPNSATAGGPGFALTVNGTGYVTGSVVQWNGTALTTTYVSGTKLTASISANLIANAGGANVTVMNPTGVVSNAAPFTIYPPSVTITSLNPNSATAGYPGFTLTVDGTGYVTGSVVQWNGTALTTTYVSGTELTASISANLIANAGGANVTVMNPTGVVSNAAPFAVNKPPNLLTIQKYAEQCYGEIGYPHPNTFPINCKAATATPLLLGDPTGVRDANGKCQSPSWASTHRNYFGAPFQCYEGSYISPIEYQEAGKGKVTGALLCKNEDPADNLNPEIVAAGKFDYIAMILYNTENGKSCWFSSPKNDTNGVELRSPNLIDGNNVPNPADPGAEKFWQEPQKNAAFQCWRCHDNGPWMNSPWLYNQFSKLKNEPGNPDKYSFVATNPDSGFGFDQWPTPVYIANSNDACLRCHKIAARRSLKLPGRTYLSNTFNEWLAYVTGGGTSPVANIDHKNPDGTDVPLDPIGSNAKPDDPALATWIITHWMPPSKRDNYSQRNVDDYTRNFSAYLVQLRACMVAVGHEADKLELAAKANRVQDVQAEVRGGLNQAEQRAVYPFRLVDCHILRGDGPRQNGGAPQQAADSRGQLVAPDVNEVDTGLTLTAHLMGPGGVVLPTVSNMRRDADAVTIPSGSLLDLAWSAGPNEGCFILASFPSGVTLQNKGSRGSGYVSSGTNWQPSESPQELGPLSEPGEYRFDLDCGSQTEASVVTETHVHLKVVPPSHIPAIPPMLMTLFTATESTNVEAADWTSYANPQNSYTDPAVPVGQVPQTDIAATATDSILISWVAENVASRSCLFSEILGSPGSPMPTFNDVGEINITLGAAAARVFQFSCTDLNGHVHLLRTRIHRDAQ